MKLYTRCKNCKTEIQFRLFVTDRVEYKMRYGENKELTCKKCNNKSLYNISDIKATESNIPRLIGLIVFLCGTPLLIFFLWDYLWIKYIYAVVSMATLILLPVSIYRILIKSEENKTRFFNQS